MTETHLPQEKLIQLTEKRNEVLQLTLQASKSLHSGEVSSSGMSWRNALQHVESCLEEFDKLRTSFPNNDYHYSMADRVPRLPLSSHLDPYRYLATAERDTNAWVEAFRSQSIERESSPTPSDASTITIEADTPRSWSEEPEELNPTPPNEQVTINLETIQSLESAFRTLYTRVHRQLSRFKDPSVTPTLEDTVSVKEDLEILTALKDVVVSSKYDLASMAGFRTAGHNAHMNNGCDIVGLWRNISDLQEAAEGMGRLPGSGV